MTITRHHVRSAGLLLFAGGTLSVALLAGGCGGDDSGAKVALNTGKPTGTAAATVTPVPPTVAASPSPGPTAARATSGSTYTVKAGDTLWDLALDWGVTVDAIVATNGLATPDDIAIGQELKVP